MNFLSLESLEAALGDEITTLAYMKAIKNNPQLFNRKIVLHLTTGTNCAYSIFAAQAGAQKVYCVINGHGDTDQKNIYMSNPSNCLNHLPSHPLHLITLTVM